jgi:radical SAM superfamily enzyme YgiQ (UPF0313 family)
MDLLLIEAMQKSPSEYNITTPPLGLGYIAAVSEDRGHSVEIVDSNVQEIKIEEKIKDANLVGVSCYTHNYHEALKIKEHAQKYGVKTVIGGPHATALPRQCVTDGFDFAVIGEGELVILEILDGVEGGNVRSVRRVSDLDGLPYPARHLLDLEKYTYPGAIATSRGCAYMCRYCSARMISGKLRLRKADKVIEEVSYLQSLNLDSFFVIDPNFAFDKKRVMEICEGVKGLGMEWFAELRLDHVDAEIIKAMAKAGCKVGRFGIESGSQRIVDLIDKRINVKDVPKIIKTFVENGITPVCGFMIGHPSETKEEFEGTLNLALKIKELGGESTFAVQTPYPGSYLYGGSDDLGIKILSDKWREYHHLNPIIETENFSNDDLRRMFFDSIIKINEDQIPGVEPPEEFPKITRIGEGLERKSFRSIAYHG